MNMSDATELIPIGIDLGSLHARVAVGNVAHSSHGGVGSAIVDAGPLPDVISNAQGSRYTLALVGTDGAAASDADDSGGGRRIFGEAARRALARDKKPTISKDPSSTVRELVWRGSSSSAADGAASEAASADAAAFFAHLADVACDASSAHASRLRAVVSVPVGSTPGEQRGVVDTVERGVGEALAGRETAKEAKARKKRGGFENDPLVMAAVTDPAAVCIAHGLTEVAGRAGAVVDLASTPKGDPTWKNALVVDWGASGVTATHMSRTSSTSSLLAVVKHVSETACSGGAIVDALVKHCASMFERKSKVAGVLDSKKACHRLEVACESAVRTLSRAPTVTVAVDGLFEGVDMNVPISRPRFDMLVSGLLRKAEALLRKFADEECGVEFDVVLLAGNVCDMPSASNLVRKIFPDANYGRGDVPPDEAVSIGCARHAAAILACDTHSKDGAKETVEGVHPATRKAKACPVTIGICRIEDGKSNGDLDAAIASSSVPLIEAGQPLPANVTRDITCSANSDGASIAIVQMMAGGAASKCKMLAKIDNALGGDKGFEITMELTTAGKLTFSINGGPSSTL